jgi:hypothetical protein
MSTARQADRLSETAVIPTVPTVPTRRSILHATASASALAPQPERGPFADWRDLTPTELLPAVTCRDAARAGRAYSRRTVARHLRSALIGTLLAIVAITGLSAYAAQGITDARSTALCQAHISCK